MTCPFSMCPLYTRPKPPSPNRQSFLKFLVATANSRKVKICAGPCVMFPPLRTGTESSFLEPEACEFDRTGAAFTAGRGDGESATMPLASFPDEPEHGKQLISPFLNAVLQMAANPPRNLGSKTRSSSFAC
uniref:Uncharacterized protein n=1 Tax=Arundo donax TaxID=35708 RepID=A0A0A9DEH4_ARUDO